MRRLVVPFAWALLIVLSLPPFAARAEPMAFQFPQERQIVFPVVLNGHQAEAWLDSGAGAIVLDAAFAKSLGILAGRADRGARRGRDRARRASRPSWTCRRAA